MSLNRIVITGNLTRDPETKFTPNGKQVTNFSVAVNRTTKDDQGKYETDFFNVVAWESTAKFVADYLTKGRKVGVDGRMQQRSWVDKDGGKHTVYDVIATQVEAFDRKPEATEEAEPDPYATGDDEPANPYAQA